MYNTVYRDSVKPCCFQRLLSYQKKNLTLAHSIIIVCFNTMISRQ